MKDIIDQMLNEGRIFKIFIRDGKCYKISKQSSSKAKPTSKVYYISDCNEKSVKLKVYDGFIGKISYITIPYSKIEKISL